MREYSVSYDLVFADGTKAETRGTACYGGLFGNGMYAGQSIVKFVAYYGVETKEMLDNANWWLESFIKRNVPKRMNSTFTVEKLEDKTCTPSWHPWIKVEFDTTKITPFDLFAALVSFRYPQENPKLVARMRKYITDGVDYDHAFIQAHTALESGYGHALLSYPMQYRLNKTFPNWTFKGAWEAVPDDILGRTRVYAVDRRRTGTVTDYLSPDCSPQQYDERYRPIEEDEEDIEEEENA